VTFDVGQKVVYPNHGVSIVEEISTAEFDSNEQTLYHLRLLSNSSKVMVPKENLDLVGLRPLCTKKQIDELFGILEDGNIDTYKDWKGRYKQNLDKMKTGRLIEVAEVLKNLSLVSQKKSLSFREKKMYERAKYFIVSEVAHVRNLDESEAEQVVEDSLEASLEKMRKAAEEAENEKSSTKKPPKSSSKASSSKSSSSKPKSKASKSSGSKASSKSASSKTAASATA